MFLTNIYLETLGYIGTILVVVSMTMKSINKLRIINVSGSIISAIYAIMISSWPIAIMNFCLISINMYHLLKHVLNKRRQHKLISNTLTQTQL